MDQPNFLATFVQAWEDWQALLALCDSQMHNQRTGNDAWALGDLIAHITWYEQEMVNLLESRTLAGSELWLQPHSVRNQAIYLQNRGRPFDTIRQEAVETHAVLHALVANLSEQDLQDPGCFRDMPADWVPWQLIAENTWEHYPQHSADVQAWLSAAD